MDVMISHFIVSIPTQTHGEEQISLLDFNKTLIIMRSKSSVFYIASSFSKFSFCPKTGSYTGFRLFLLPIPVTITFGLLSLRLGRDFHWYRLDSDGKWSHKPGITRVSQYDNAGHYITDPRNCSKGSYTFFCFMSTDKNTVKIR